MRSTLLVLQDGREVIENARLLVGKPIVSVKHRSIVDRILDQRSGVSLGGRVWQADHITEVSCLKCVCMLHV